MERFTLERHGGALEFWAAAALFPQAVLATQLSAFIGVLKLGGTRIRLAALSYLAWVVFLDRSPDRGGYEWAWRIGLCDFLRKSSIGRKALRYYSPSLIRTTKLAPEEGPYIFVCHPHGIWGLGPTFNFCSHSIGWEELFPGIRVHLLGHRVMFRLPFFREIILLWGCASVSKSCFRHVLSKGDSVALAPGGARESIETQPHALKLYLAQRRGFARIALETGGTLVPVLTYGENEVYDCLRLEDGTFARRIQEALQKMLGFAFPLFIGIRWMPWMPKRQTTLNTIVGPPVKPAKSPADGVPPIEEEVAELHKRYCEALQELHKQHRDEHGYGDVELELV